MKFLKKSEKTKTEEHNKKIVQEIKLIDNTITKLQKEKLRLYNQLMIKG